MEVKKMAESKIEAAKNFKDKMSEKERKDRDKKLNMFLIGAATEYK